MSAKITVCVDIRDLRIAKTGEKTYLEGICKEFKNGFSGFTFHFIDTWLPVYTGNNKILKIIEHIRFFGWKQVSLPLICWIKGCDILYCIDYFLPLIKLNFKTAIVFHDAFFWEYPEHYNPLWLKLLNLISVPAAKKADAVLTVTEYSKTQILKYVKIDPEKIHVAHLALKSNVFHTVMPGVISNLPKKYILHVGALEKRKNLLNLIKAYHLLRQEGFEDYYLVLVGNKVYKKTIDDSENINHLIKSKGLQEKVLLPGFILEDQLSLYFSNASLYAFVSINEGFGFPLLEAFQHDLPVLIANNSCLPEVGGDAVIMCNPFDVNDIKNKMKLILSDHELQKDMIDKGSQRLTLFSWNKTALSLLNVFESIVHK